MSTSQPAWHQPHAGCKTGLRVFNSLTSSKVDFIPKKSNVVSWYICGPTVYDVSHMGHARTYVIFDVVRRIMEDYFNYNLQYVMNVTDVDDKIIVKAHKEILSALISAVDDESSKAARHVLESKTSTLRDIMAAAQSVREVAATRGVDQNLLNKEPDFVGVARRFEKEFLDDMVALQVRYPDVLLRVTEHIPQIVAFVEKIVAAGYAYENDGSVYFNTQAFNSSDKHVYGKLEPWSIGVDQRNEEAEGSLSSATATSKLSPNDFALWKKSKEGEPSWASPWGQGRPGWHIECSAMASDVLGENLDIHCGGIDLRFPHHENEIAQSEAYFDNKQWVNYFLHAGHLNIQGAKMSKSLKNFISIKDALETFNSRQIRMLFLLHKFDAAMDYSQETMDAAVFEERYFNEFFQNVKTLLRQGSSRTVANETEFWDTEERELHTLISDRKTAVHEALSDNFNTPLAILHLKSIVAATNVYIQRRVNASQQVRLPLIRVAANYLTHIFKVFGLIDNVDDIGFRAIGSTDGNFESAVSPYLDMFSSFRDQVRAIARDAAASTTSPEAAKELLKLCDFIRDNQLPNIGVRLEDRTDGKAVWKLEDPQVLLQEKQRKEQAAQEAKRVKEEQRLLREAQEKAKWEKAKIAPKDLFQIPEKYSQWDENGIPTHDHEGKELSKSAKKTVTQAYDKQVKIHQEYLTKFGPVASTSTSA